MLICYTTEVMNIAFAEKLIKKMEVDYDVIADHFSETRLAPWPEFTLIEQLIQPGQQVLDIGCGNGRLAETAQKIKAYYTGIDLSEKLITQARELYGARYPDAHFLHGSMLELPFENDSFDIIVAVSSVLHIPSSELRSQAISEMMRVARPGATLFLVNWNLYQDVLPDYFSAAKIEFGTEWEPGDALIPWKDKYGTVLAQRYYHGFTEEELADLLVSTEWVVQEQYYMARAKRTDKQAGFNLITIAKKNP